MPSRLIRSLCIAPGKAAALRCPLPRVMLPCHLAHVAAGFPNPAEDFLESPVDLAAYLVRNDITTFLFRVAGDSMRDAGIFSGDVLVVDRAEDARDGDIVVAVIDGERVVKRLRLSGGQPRLLSENPAYPPILLREFTALHIWGVVRHAIHTFR